MDIKCVRVLRPYEEEDNNELTIYVEDSVKESLRINWGDMVIVKGRYDTKAAIKPLKMIDQDGFIARAGQKLIDEAYIEYGEEVLLEA